jgi:hypothetical protein
MENGERQKSLQAGIAVAGDKRAKSREFLKDV